MKISDIFPQIDKSWVEVNISEHVDLIKSNKEWLSVLEDKYKGLIYGGFLENRTPLYNERHDSRFPIHVGVDLWLPEGTEVYSPVTGIVVYSGKTDNCRGGWGNRIDILHRDKIYIFGHLDNGIPRHGKVIIKGKRIGKLGSRETNGGWRPHLHIQVMELEDYFRWKNPREIDAYSTKNKIFLNKFYNPFEL